MRSSVVSGGSAWTARVVALGLGAAALTALAPAAAQEATNYRIVATVENVGAGPTGVAVNTRTKTVYVTNRTQADRPGALAVVDGNANQLERMIFSAPDMPNPAHVAVDSTNGRVFVTNPQAAEANRLTVLDSDAITGTLNVGTMATSVTVDETDSPRKVYVSNYGDASRNVSGITIIHTSDGPSRVHATTSFSPSRGLTTVAVDTESMPHKAWAVNANTGADPLAGSLTVAESQVNKATFTNWSGVLPPPRKPGLVAVRPSTHTLYLADQTTDQVHLVNVSGQVPATAPRPFATERTVGAKPVAMAYDAGTDRLFVLYAAAADPAADGELTVLDAASGDVLQHLPLPSPGGMTLDPTDGVLWVTDTANGNLHKVAETFPDKSPSRPAPLVPDGSDPSAGQPRFADPFRSIGPGSQPPAGNGSVPEKRRLPASNGEGEPCGAVTTRPKC